MKWRGGPPRPAIGALIGPRLPPIIPGGGGPGGPARVSRESINPGVRSSLFNTSESPASPPPGAQSLGPGRSPYIPSARTPLLTFPAHPRAGTCDCAPGGLPLISPILGGPPTWNGSVGMGGGGATTGSRATPMGICGTCATGSGSRLAGASSGHDGIRSAEAYTAAAQKKSTTAPRPKHHMVFHRGSLKSLRPHR
jgi:hypothetical protein